MGGDGAAAAKKKRMAIVGVAVATAVALLVAAALLGFLIGFASGGGFGDDECDASGTGGDTTPAPSPSPSPAPSPSPSPSYAPPPNDEGKNANQEYYESAPVHPFGIDDLLRVDRLGEARVSPDGTKAAFTRRVYNYDTNQTCTTVWMRDLVTDEDVELTQFGWGISESNPCWASDSSTVLFLSNRDPSKMGYGGASTQVWQITASAGETPSRLTSYEKDLLALECSPTDSHIAVAASVVPGMSMYDSATLEAQAREGALRAHLYDKLMVRHWDKWYWGERNHVFLQSLSFESGRFALGGEIVDLVFDLDADVPTKPYGGREEWSFAHDGSAFAFTRRHDEDSSVAWTTNLDIYTVSIAASGSSWTYGAPVGITLENSAADTQPRYSPDGASIAYLAQQVPGYESDRTRINIHDIASGVNTVLTEEWDRSIDSIQWTSDSETLIATALDTAREKIFSVSAADGSHEQLLQDHSASSVNVLPDDETLVFLWESMEFPATLYRLSPSATEPEKLSTFNDELFAKSTVSETIEFQFPGDGGDLIHAWAFSATEGAGEEGQTEFPLAFLIHGGPQSTWGDDWSYRWNPQCWTGHGYAVVMIDFHGSEGYGQAFTDSITNHYGDRPYNDLMMGLDFALDTFDFIDEQRLTALGASFGGWMINWINGHPWLEENRFARLVCHDGIFDERIFWFETEELWFPEHDMEGTPLDPLSNSTSNYETWNPANFVDQWETPTLIIHGGHDYRIPDTHGLGAFTALQRQGVESKFLYFPTESHWVQTPANSKFWYDTVLEWLDEA